MDPKQLELERPCDMAWDEMPGTDRRRFCAACGEDVHDLSAMTEGEAEALMADDVHRCIRYTIGTDGWVQHRTEPPKRRSRWRRRAAVLLAGVGLATSVPALAASQVSKEGMVGLVERVREWIDTWFADESETSKPEEPAKTEREAPVRPQMTIVVGGVPVTRPVPPPPVTRGGKPPSKR